jgi:hypothetical protein
MKLSKPANVLLNNQNDKEVIWMAKKVEVRKIVSNLSKLGIQAKITKPRVELFRALALPQTQSQT